MKHRILCAVLALAMLLALLPAQALAADQVFSGTCSDSVSWELNATTGVLSITGTGTVPDYTYSETAPWYLYRSRIFTVKLSQGITALGSYALYECTRLTELDAQDSALASLGERALGSCSALTALKLPKTALTLGDGALENCTALVELSFPGGLRAIGAEAFSGCTALEELDLSGLTGTVGQRAFSGCAGLKTVTLPKQLTAIPAYAFYECTALEEDVMPESLQTVGDFAFYRCQTLKEVVFPATLTSLGRSCFAGSALEMAGFAGNVPEMAAQSSVSATFPKTVLLTYDYKATGWTWPIYKGYDTERIYPSLDGIFTDLSLSSWYIPFVEHAYYTGLMNGMSASTFAPNDGMTRAQLVTVLYRIAGSPATTAENPFTDVKAGKFYYDAVRWAYANKIVNGITATTFEPNQPITREQLCVFLYRYAKLCELPTEVSVSLTFTDAASISNYARDAVGWCVQQEIINGQPDGSMQPQGSATRAQVAKVLTLFDALRCYQKLTEDDNWNNFDPDPTPTPDPDVDPEDPDYVLSKEIFTKLNEYRVKEGLPELTWSDKLYTAAAVRAGEISKPNALNHTRPDGSSYDTAITEAGLSFDARNEILAHGYTTVEGVVDGWTHTDATRPALVSKAYTTAAVATAKNEAGHTYYIMLFIG